MTQKSHYWACNLRKPQFLKTHIRQCIAALFTIARTWKPPQCLSMDEGIKKWWYIYTMVYYSAIKMNKFESVLVSWINLELLHRMK